MLDVVIQAVENSPITIPPTINGLFDVSYNQTVCSLRQPFEQEQFEVAPLHSAGILKLVYHDIMDICPYLFEYKRGVTVFHQLVKQGVRVWQQKTVVVVVQLTYFFVDIGEKLHFIEMLQG